jgi:hypothetical protein
MSRTLTIRPTHVLATAAILVAMPITSSAAPTPPPPVVTADPPVVVASNVTQVPGSCANYNSDVVQNGAVTPSGVKHPGACRFTELRVMLNGMLADRYTKSLSSGKLAVLPYVPKVSGSCLTASKVKIHLSAQIETSLTNWLHGRPAQSICGAQWSEHDPAQLVPPSALQGPYLQVLLNHLATGLKQELIANPPHVCGLRQAQQALADNVANLLNQFAARAQSELSSLQARVEDPVQSQCAVDCNICSPGWAGTITLQQKVLGGTGNPGFEFDLVEEHFVGGSASAPVNGHTYYPVNWMATGPATIDGSPAKNGGGTSNYHGTLNASLPGTCASGVGVQTVCMDVYTMGGTTYLLPYNTPQTAPGYNVTSTAGSITGAAIQETLYIRQSTSGQTPFNVQPLVPTPCGDKPPQIPGGTVTCQATWSGQLQFLP